MCDIRVVIADNHNSIRSALISYLSKGGHGIQMVGEASSGSEALRLCRETSPDVLLLDLKLPDIEGSEVVRQLQAAGLPIRVLVLSAFFGLIDRHSIMELLDYGVGGCITKNEVIDLLVPAIRSVAGGEVWLSPQVQGYLNGGSQAQTA